MKNYRDSLRDDKLAAASLESIAGAILYTLDERAAAEICGWKPGDP